MVPKEKPPPGISPSGGKMGTQGIAHSIVTSPMPVIWPTVRDAATYRSCIEGAEMLERPVRLRETPPAKRMRKPRRGVVAQNRDA